MMNTVINVELFITALLGLSTTVLSIIGAIMIFEYHRDEKIRRFRDYHEDGMLILVGVAVISLCWNFQQKLQAEEKILTFFGFLAIMMVAILMAAAYLYFMIDAWQERAKGIVIFRHAVISLTAAFMAIGTLAVTFLPANHGFIEKSFGQASEVKAAEEVDLDMIQFTDEMNGILANGGSPSDKREADLGQQMVANAAASLNDLDDAGRLNLLDTKYKQYKQLETSKNSLPSQDADRVAQAKKIDGQGQNEAKWPEEYAFSDPTNEEKVREEIILTWFENPVAGTKALRAYAAEYPVLKENYQFLRDFEQLDKSIFSEKRNRATREKDENGEILGIDYFTEVKDGKVINTIEYGTHIAQLVEVVFYSNLFEYKGVEQRQSAVQWILPMQFKDADTEMLATLSEEATDKIIPANLRHVSRKTEAQYQDNVRNIIYRAKFSSGNSELGIGASDQNYKLVEGAKAVSTMGNNGPAEYGIGVSDQNFKIFVEEGTTVTETPKTEEPGETPTEEPGEEPKEDEPGGNPGGDPPGGNPPDGGDPPNPPGGGDPPATTEKNSVNTSANSSDANKGGGENAGTSKGNNVTASVNKNNNDENKAAQDNQDKQAINNTDPTITGGAAVDADKTTSSSSGSTGNPNVANTTQTNPMQGGATDSGNPMDGTGTGLRQDSFSKTTETTNPDGTTSTTTDTKINGVSEGYSEGSSKPSGQVTTGIMTDIAD